MQQPVTAKPVVPAPRVLQLWQAAPAPLAHNPLPLALPFALPLALPCRHQPCQQTTHCPRRHPACSFDTDAAGSSYATGFVVDRQRGLILTNRHVVTPGEWSPGAQGQPSGTEPGGGALRARHAGGACRLPPAGLFSPVCVTHTRCQARRQATEHERPLSAPPLLPLLAGCNGLQTRGGALAHGALIPAYLGLVPTPPPSPARPRGGRGHISEPRGGAGEAAVL